MASNDPERREEEIGDTAAGEDEDWGAQIPPIVRLEEVTITTGEEDEDVLLDLKAKLYRFYKESIQWKERGTGSVKILKHKKVDRTRLVMRQCKTLKICANHFILPSIKLQEHSGNEMSCVWHAIDFSDEELKDVMFCIRFTSVDNCKLFMETVEKQAKAFGKKKKKKNKKVDTVTGKFKKLSIGKGNSEKKVVEEETVTSDSNEKEEEKEKEEKAETKIQMTSNVPERRGEEISDTTAGKDEVAVITEEEDHDILLNLKAKLYYFDKEIIKWKVRGTGSVKILKHKKVDSTRIVMQQCQTLKICANHFILPSIKLQEHSKNEKSCLWHALDYSEEELKDVTFWIRFASVDNCKLFIETVEKQAKLYGMIEDKENNNDLIM